MSDYTDNLAKTSATNYSVQPGGIHESFPAQASGGQSEHSDSEGLSSNSANVQMNTRVNAMREERSIQATQSRPYSDAFK
jgi:hypothetical protein